MSSIYDTLIILNAIHQLYSLTTNSRLKMGGKGIGR